MLEQTPREVLVIGGNRYFGKRLIRSLLDSGDRVTVLNRGSAPPPPGALHLVADRDDEASLTAALAGRSFDVVVDQVCYTPRQAAVAARVFTGRTRRYVMTSTVEVYEYQDAAAPLAEGAVDPLAVPVDLDLRWEDPEVAAARYGEGKRQAEAVLAAAPGLPYVAVRVAHVLGGADDFTGRVAHYADRLRAGEPIGVSVPNHPATYIHVDEIAAFLDWATRQEFTGPVNAAAHGPLRTADIVAAVAEALPGGPYRADYRPAAAPGDGDGDGGVGGGPQPSPFSFARSYGMDNSYAERLGFRFSHTRDWLRRAVAETLEGN
ncbi:NAD-dependent epimerase/dehydratase family protein [Streptomyces antimicrobicus]|uniref:NAD-dependent epimerase/dehydratase family protein n=1 Tax=Streptomyces antimicrobicus TaxID=2883108 RepID=A0ABS8BAZ3_9ACTN|nr:NAD-dependent epimerase/dehydratase family protein [Streptomyces antimicrobicus]MCB5181806.1 NAD-dependent epimerase/dehydratase family protein [Streptomyces antimicrobicus]